MKRRPTDQRRSDCPISIALEIVGDRWSLLIVRDLMLKGRTTFGEFLDSGEGVASNVLADRLARLEKHGVIEPHADSQDKRRRRYRLTRKGVDLAPVLVDMILWAASYEHTAAPKEEVEAMNKERSSYLAEIRARWAAAHTDVA
jgi:DNA-binding HxlR family transcriptional regulator